MTREEKCELAIELGYKCDPNTGKVYGPKGFELISTDGRGYYDIQSRHFGHIKSHQFIWYWVTKECVDSIDHKNRNKLDNRITNLRSVTNQENSFNKECKGHYWYKEKNKWKACISVNNKLIHLGYFNTADEARESYLNGKHKYHKINE
jgi:hypothetical protein